MLQRKTLTWDLNMKHELQNDGKWKYYPESEPRLRGRIRCLRTFSASKGLNFDQSSLWPTDYEGQLFACHASLPHRQRAQPVCARWGGVIDAAVPELVEAHSLLTARFGVFSGLVALSTWHHWLLKIERWIVREIKQCCFNTDRHTDGAESDPDADTASRAPNRFVQRFPESVPRWQQPQKRL